MTGKRRLGFPTQAPGPWGQAARAISCAQKPGAEKSSRRSVFVAYAEWKPWESSCDTPDNRSAVLNSDSYGRRQLQEAAGHGHQDALPALRPDARLAGPERRD